MIILLTGLNTAIASSVPVITHGSKLGLVIWYVDLENKIMLRTSDRNAREGPFFPLQKCLKNILRRKRRKEKHPRSWANRQLTFLSARSLNGERTEKQKRAL